MRSLRVAGGFTLIEVVVALVIVALGLSALLAILNQSAANVAAMRDRTVAEWIAMNQLALVRLSLNAPGPGQTEGDINNCGNGNWHWQQRVTPVDAVPGLLSITVSVRRTGNATPTSSTGRAAASSAPGAPTAPNGPGATGALGPSVSLGPTQPLGSVTALSTTGCASAPSAGGSLGATNPLGGAPGSLGASGSPGGPGSLGASSTLGPGSLGGTGGSGSVTNPFQTSGSSSSTSGSSNGSASNGVAWLVTLTGYRGTSVGQSVGESPDWAGTPLAGAPGATGTGNSSTGNAGTTPTIPQALGAIGSAAGS